MKCSLYQGSGCIGRGFRGSFRGRNIHPGKYAHMNVLAVQFSIRVKRNGVVHAQVRASIARLTSYFISLEHARTLLEYIIRFYFSDMVQVLSVEDSTQVPPLLSSWTWALPMSSGTYYALFPR